MPLGGSWPPGSAPGFMAVVVNTIPGNVISSFQAETDKIFIDAIFKFPVAAFTFAIGYAALTRRRQNAGYVAGKENCVHSAVLHSYIRC